jgi:mRNA interferase MazF
MIQAKINASSSFPRYGDIYDVVLDPVIGSEIGEQRPALVVSNNQNNEYSSTVTVLPITGQPAKKVYPFEVFIRLGNAGLSVDSLIKADQIRTIDKKRLISYRGTLPDTFLPEVEKALKVHLNLK